MQSGIGDTWCTGEVEHPPSPVLQEVVLSVTYHREERLKTTEAGNGLSVTALHEAAAALQRDPQMGKAESAQHVVSVFDVMQELHMGSVVQPTTA